MSNIIAQFEKGYFGPEIRVIVTLEENTRQVWGFTYDPRSHSIKPRDFYLEKRETPRHKWKVKEKYQKTETRTNTIPACPIPPPDVRAVALDRFIQELTVGEGVQ